ncbi:hypothetical protein JW979_03185 [bacterium]|nr:hypothetical protein [candidate division CSSED10-310 bacterium]
MTSIIRDQEGNVLVFTAFALVVLVGFTALSIDVGLMMTARNQLQNAVDAAALAGASGLINNGTDAVSNAIFFAAQNTCINQPVQISAADVSFPTSTRIQVQANQQINLFFAGVLGMPTTTVSAVATAEIETLVGTKKVAPWAIPYDNWKPGDTVKLKSGAGDPKEKGFFSPVCFPPQNKGTPITGASAYYDNIRNGSSMTIAKGDVLLVEPGNMVAQTKQAAEDLMALDPDAKWTDSGIEDSAFPPGLSPRLVKIPLWDNNFPPDPGRNTVEVIGLAVFFVKETTHQEVKGIFLEDITFGVRGSGVTFLKAVKLVQ